MTPDAEYTYGRRGSIVIAAGCCGHAMNRCWARSWLT